MAVWVRKAFRLGFMGLGLTELNFVRAWVSAVDFLVTECFDI